MYSVPRALGASLIFLAASGALPAFAQQSPPPDSPAAAVMPPPPYAPFADLVLAAPVIIDATIQDVARIKGAEAQNVAPGRTRLYVTATVNALIRGPGALPPQLGYLLDIPVGPGGRIPKMRKLHVLLFARPVAGQQDQIQLVRPDAQREWTPAADALVRSITRDLLSPDSSPRVIGISHAFHMPGTLPGEGETQIFLATPDNRPVSLSIVRKNDQAPSWTIALNEIVDQAKPPPPRDTFLWYRLACSLPASLPQGAIQADNPDDARAAADDYAFVIRSLGTCDR
jgi:hypothetical protein